MFMKEVKFGHDLEIVENLPTRESLVIRTTALCCRTRSTKLNQSGKKTEAEPPERERHLPIDRRHRVDLPQVTTCHRYRPSVSSKGKCANQRRPRAAERGANDDDITSQRDRHDGSNQTRADDHPYFRVPILRSPNQANGEYSEASTQGGQASQIDQDQDRRTNQPTGNELLLPTVLVCQRRTTLSRCSQQNHRAPATTETNGSP